MSRIFVCGLGAVSPAGWGVLPMIATLTKGDPLPVQTLTRPGSGKPMSVLNVPPPEPRPAFFAHPRLRRASVITLHTVAAALEALGDDVALVQSGTVKLGIIVCTMAGSVTYSRRFYEEVLRDPATASPLLFPETVFNAPASHLAAFLGTNAPGYTMVGDDGTFLQGLAVAAEWLLDDRVEAVLVVGAEESDWVVAEAMTLFQRHAIHSTGAGAVYLKKHKKPDRTVELMGITDPFLFTQKQNRLEAARKMMAQLPVVAANELLCDSELNDPADWVFSGERLTPKAILGEAFAASAAWQCVAACHLIEKKQITAANVSVVGTNQQTIGARFAGNNL